MLQKKVLEKIKTHFMFNTLLFRKSCLLGDNVERHGTAIHVTRDRWQHNAASTPNATDTHSEYVLLIVFLRRQLLSYTPLSVLYNLIKRCITHAIDIVLLNNLTISMSYLFSYRGFVKL